NRSATTGYASELAHDVPGGDRLVDYVVSALEPAHAAQVDVRNRLQDTAVRLGDRSLASEWRAWMGDIVPHDGVGVGCQRRLDVDRLRSDRLERIKGLLKSSELGSLVCFDPNNIRYITSTLIGTWSNDKFVRWCLLPQEREPIMWDFGSAARHHQLYNPWLDGRSRAGITNFRGGIRPEAGRAEDVAHKIKVELEAAGLANEPVGVDIVEPPIMFALQAAGLKVVDGQQLMLQARMIKSQD